MITNERPRHAGLVYWAPEQTHLDGDVVMRQRIGCDKAYLYDISLQINHYDDEDDVVQLSISWAPSGASPNPAWRTVFYRNWQRPDVEIAVAIAESIVEEAVTRTRGFISLYVGTDISEAN
jgi:hypothetical protein